jgi:hypothetical protein
MSGAAYRAINQVHEHARVDLGVSGSFEGERHSARGPSVRQRRAVPGPFEAAQQWPMTANDEYQVHESTAPEPRKPSPPGISPTDLGA